MQRKANLKENLTNNQKASLTFYGYLDEAISIEV